MSANPAAVSLERPPEAWLLLLGEQALAQKPRLELSGYGCLQESDDLHQPSQGHHRDLDSASDALDEAREEARDNVDPSLLLLSADQAGRIAELRQRWPGCPILLDIEDDSIEARTHCLTAGADDFWLSSLGASDLLGRLRVHLKLVARQARRPVCLRVGDLEVDPARHQVRRGLRRLALTSREYSLLLLLVQNHGQVLSREMILATIWSDQQGSASNVIEVYVRYLRQKLEEGGERRLIHTVRGAGYCLSDRPPGQEGPATAPRPR
jgi:DNA-binding response OmpR family regulator